MEIAAVVPPSQWRLELRIMKQNTVIINVIIIISLGWEGPVMHEIKPFSLDEKGFFMICKS